MARPDCVRLVPLGGLQIDILERLACILVDKPDVPEGVVALIGIIPRLWDEDRFEVGE